MQKRVAAAQARQRTAVEAAERGAEGGGAAGGWHVRGDQVVHGRQRNALTQAHARPGQQHGRHRQACARHLCANISLQCRHDVVPHLLRVRNAEAGVLRRTGADSATGSSIDASENQAMPHANTTFPATRPASGHLSKLMCVPQSYLGQPHRRTCRRACRPAAA